MSDTSRAVAPQQKPLSVSQGFLFGWRMFFQPRERIIREFYQNMAKSNHIPLDSTASLDVARQRLSESFPNIFPNGNLARDRMESRVVLGSRIMVACTALWFSLFPLGVVVGFLVMRLKSIRVITLPDVILNSVLAVLFFYLAYIGGILFLAILTKPFVAFLNWLLGTPQY